ncbi:FAD:protein FMN transferase [Salinibacterium sp. UTAS2018]|uniref:FAD:protein FMN transferase n=1 Tax=Salinibacterium sp. UTAS2018 TaxID=2508880 RepID=UPI00100968FD|nr:FAD:protein FMN transferase [Salinibacterium sp. UTAS2018]QAV70151.1 FAD:protein FMN transferase [Salinibacterium sp. UTAS2018]
MPSPSKQFDAIGAPWQIDTTEPLGSVVETAIAQRIELFDRTYSRFRDDSLVRTIAHTPGTYSFPADAPPLFELYRRLYDATAGAMSPLVGRALEELGYDRTYSLQPAAIRTRVPEWHEAISWNGSALTTLTPAVLDVGAAGKGYLVDLVAGVLAEHGVTTSTVDASGDILHRGAGELRVALEHPLDSSKAIGVVTVSNEAICASAPNRRAWAGLHHILDARTGQPTDRIIATWAIAPTALEADGLATALFLAEPAELKAEFDFHWVRMHSTGRVEHSADLPGEVFL